MELTKALRFDLKRLKRSLQQMQVEHKKQIPDYLLGELIEVENTLTSMEMGGYLDLPEKEK
jgi:hypothetical protein